MNPLRFGNPTLEVSSMSELPVGFVMTLAMNESAMKRFAGMSEMEKQSVIARAHSARTKQEMEALVHGLAR